MDKWEISIVNIDGSSAVYYFQGDENDVCEKLKAIDHEGASWYIYKEVTNYLIESEGKGIFPRK